MLPYRIVFMGTPAFAVPSLVNLAERAELCDVVAVICQPDKPAGRGRKVSCAAVKIQAQALGIPVLTPTKMKSPETLAQLSELRPDFAIVAAYGRILPATLLAVPKLGCLNVHASLLPRHRGASPIAHAILAADAQAGVCIMKMDEGLDTGPVYSRRSIPIDALDTCGSLTIKLAELGAALLLDSLPQIGTGVLQPVPQADEGMTYATLLRKEDGGLDFCRPASSLAQQVRAFHPWPGTYTFQGGSRLAVLRAHVAPDSGNPRAAAGTVLRAGGSGVLVACGEGALCLDEVKPEGRKAMAAAAWVAGRGIGAGAVLGNASIQSP